MESQGGARGPFRATQLWRELRACYRARMPLTTHWQRFKRRDNCFTAREAVDWLHEHLINNSNFGPEVTRQQAVKLLRKFLQSHVIEDVQGRWGSEHLDDNKQLFRFPTTSVPQTVPPSHPELSKSSFKNIAEKKKSLFQLPGYLAEFLRSVSIR